jgi:hypothetical protein
MSKRSKIDTMVPQTIKDQLAKLFREGCTIDTIKAKLDELHANGESPVTVSRSAIGTFVGKANKAFERYKLSQEMAEMLVPAFGEQARGDLGMAAAELLKGVCYQHAAELSDDEEFHLGDKSKIAMFLSSALKNAVSTSKDAHALRVRVRKEALEEAAKRVSQEAKSRGLTDEIAESLISRILEGKV